jgi:hypothetical protein
MKFHSGTHSGTAVSGLETANFSTNRKRGNENQYGFYMVKKNNWLRRCNGEL